MLEPKLGFVTASFCGLSRLCGSVLVLVVLGAFLVSPRAAEQPTAIFELGRTNDDVIEPFTVDDAWSVEWSTEDQRIESD